MRVSLAHCSNSSPALTRTNGTQLVRDDWENAKHGDCVQTDQWWHHRFGKVKTLWAGTTEHSLSNWYGHPLIFKHFDETRNLNTESQGGNAKDIQT